MDIKDCEILKILSEELNLTKTAEKLYTSQPALSYRLNKIEEELGVNILNRHSNGVTLTKEGIFLSEFCKKILLDFENMKEHIKFISSDFKDELRIGVSTTIAKYRIAQILYDFKENFPNIKIKILTGRSHFGLPELLKNNRIDLAIFRGGETWNDIKYIIGKEPYGIITNFSFDIDKIVTLPYIQYDTNSIVKSNLFLNEWKKENLNKNIDIIKVDSIEASLEMVKAGLGWTVLPKIHIQNFPNLHFYPLMKGNKEPYTRETYLITNKKNLKNCGVKTFIEFILSKEDDYFNFFN